MPAILIGASHETCRDVFARYVALNGCTRRRIYGEDAFSVIACVFARCHYVGWNDCVGGRPTATQDSQGNNIANNFEAQVKQVFAQVDGVLKRAGGSLDNVVTMTVFIKESRYGDKFVEMRKDAFKDGNYPGSALITVTNFARPGIEIEIQAVGVIGDNCSNDNPCSAEARVKKTQSK